MSGVSPQLKAIRQAVRWKKSEPPKDPLVRMYLKLMETNPREVAQQLERLEKEHRLASKVAQPESSKAAPVSSPKPERAASDEDYERGDGYDPRSDTTTPAVLGMIDRWLAGCKSRAEAGLGLPESAAPVEDDSDDLDIPG